jgi:integrase
LKYRPSRDLPKAVLELRTLKASELKLWVQENRTQKNKKTGKQEQADITPEAVIMWFKRHPAIHQKLEAELTGSERTEGAISETLFQNGNLYNVKSIANWNRDMTIRGVKDSLRKSWIARIKRICLGQIRKERIEGWGIKHPDRLTVENGKDYIYEMKKRKLKTRGYRLALRGFLTSKGIVVRSTDISGELEQDHGQYSDLFVSIEKLNQIFEYLKEHNYEAYLASKFSFNTASRLTATLEAHSQYMNRSEHAITVFEKSKARKEKRRIIKMLPSNLWKLIEKRTGKLFNIEGQELSDILREAYRLVIPELADRIPMPFHFWRHMFAQHMLRKTGWNYGLVAKLGGWTTGALERYYGKMPQAEAFRIGKDALEQL